MAQIENIHQTVAINEFYRVGNPYARIRELVQGLIELWGNRDSLEMGMVTGELCTLGALDVADKFTSTIQGEYAEKLFTEKFGNQKIK